MTRNTRTLAIILLLACGCDEDGNDTNPDPSELYGIWVTGSGATDVLVIEMRESDSTYTDLEGVSPVYYISRYERGNPRS